MAKFQAPKGVSEYIAPASIYFSNLRNLLTKEAENSGYQLMELAVFEDTELFERGVGQSTDVVRKEMYTFEDRGGRSITLRPEGTAGVMRSVIENNLDKGQLPIKVWYTGQYFRAERPQKGRFRQFYQFGIEAIGLNDPEIDVEVIAVADRAFKKLGLKNYTLEITSLGDAESRAAHRKDLVAYISKLNLDEETQERAKLNPLRIFDDKRPEVAEKMKSAPKLLDYLTSASKENFERVQSLLEELDIKFSVNPNMVRGLDYYTGTTFEFSHQGLGAQSGIGGGGRYDGLMKELGGADLSGIGFGIGLDRVLLAMEAEGLINFEVNPNSPKIFLIALSEESKLYVTKLLNDLRIAGVNADMAYGDRALKGSMKAADKSGAEFVVVVGPDEVTSGKATLKAMKSGQEKEVRLSALKDELKY
jgi:histidyl-tRNA synthetase